MKEKIKLAISGISGRMGQKIVALVQSTYASQFQIVCGIAQEGKKLEDAPPFDVMVDFSAPSFALSCLKYCAQKKIPAVSGTTGFNSAELQQLETFGKQIPLVYASNMSIGVHVLWKLVKEASHYLQDWDVALAETHHREKKDAPSGTALYLKNALQGTHSKASISSTRGGGEIGEHQVFFFGTGEKIILTHTATDRTIFAEGALRACLWLMNQKELKPGIFSFSDLLTGLARNIH